MKALIGLSREEFAELAHDFAQAFTQLKQEEFEQGKSNGIGKRRSGVLDLIPNR